MKKSNALPMKIYRLRLKRLIFNHYGKNDPRCNLCGENELSKLTIGHIKNDGKQDRKTTGLGSNFYQWLKNNKFPDNGYSIECFSCNCSKRIERINTNSIVKNNIRDSLSYRNYNVYGSLSYILYRNYNILFNIF